MTTKKRDLTKSNKKPTTLEKRAAPMTIGSAHTALQARDLPTQIDSSMDGETLADDPRLEKQHERAMKRTLSTMLKQRADSNENSINNSRDDDNN